jgi:hypothetical protein
MLSFHCRIPSSTEKRRYCRLSTPGKSTAIADPSAPGDSRLKDIEISWFPYHLLSLASNRNGPRSIGRSLVNSWSIVNCHVRMHR